MASWGAYFKSYVKKEEALDAAQQEAIAPPTLKTALPRDQSSTRKLYSSPAEGPPAAALERSTSNAARLANLFGSKSTVSPPQGSAFAAVVSKAVRVAAEQKTKGDDVPKPLTRSGKERSDSGVAMSGLNVKVDSGLMIPSLPTIPSTPITAEPASVDEGPTTATSLEADVSMPLFTRDVSHKATSSTSSTSSSTGSQDSLPTISENAYFSSVTINKPTSTVSTITIPSPITTTKINLINAKSPTQPAISRVSATSPTRNTEQSALMTKDSKASASELDDLMNDLMAEAAPEVEAAVDVRSLAVKPVQPEMSPIEIVKPEKPAKSSRGRKPSKALDLASLMDDILALEIEQRAVVPKPRFRAREAESGESRKGTKEDTVVVMPSGSSERQLAIEALKLPAEDQQQDWNGVRDDVTSVFKMAPILERTARGPRKADPDEINITLDFDPQNPESDAEEDPEETIIRIYQRRSAQIQIERMQMDNERRRIEEEAAEFERQARLFAEEEEQQQMFLRDVEAARIQEAEEEKRRIQEDERMRLEEMERIEVLQKQAEEQRKLEEEEAANEMLRQLERINAENERIEAEKAAKLRSKFLAEDAMRAKKAKEDAALKEEEQWVRAELEAAQLEIAKAAQMEAERLRLIAEKISRAADVENEGTRRSKVELDDLDDFILGPSGYTIKISSPDNVQSLPVEARSRPSMTTNRDPLQVPDLRSDELSDYESVYEDEMYDDDDDYRSEIVSGVPGNKPEVYEVAIMLDDEATLEEQRRLAIKEEEDNYWYQQKERAQQMRDLATQARQAQIEKEERARQEREEQAEQLNLKREEEERKAVLAAQEAERKAEEEEELEMERYEKEYADRQRLKAEAAERQRLEDEELEQRRRNQKQVQLRYEQEQEERVRYAKEEEDRQRSVKSPARRRQMPKSSPRPIKDDDDEEDRPLTKEEKMAEAEEKIRLAFNLLAEERAQTASGSADIDRPPPTPPKGNYSPGFLRSPPFQRSPTLARSPTTPRQAGSAMSAVTTLGPMRFNTVAGTPRPLVPEKPATAVVGRANTVGPRMGLPSGPRGGLPNGPRGGIRPTPRPVRAEYRGQI